MMTDYEPSATHLFNIPYVVDGVRYQLLVYTNDLSFEEKSGRDTTRSFGADPLKTFYSTMLERGYTDSAGSVPSGFSQVTTTPDTALMIVAIPNPTGATNFGLVDVTTDKMKQFRSEAKNVGDSLIPWQYTLSATNSFGDGDSFGVSQSLMVHRVGNYDISVAPSLEALEKQIDWSHFDLPADFEKRKTTLSDSSLFPYPCAYVVAKAVTSVKDDGFAVLFPDPGFTYFPTCHENTTTGYNDYDVRCYQFGSKKEITFPFKVVYDKSEISYGKEGKYSFNSTEGNKVAHIGRVNPGNSGYALSFTTNDLKVIRKMLSYLPKEAVMSETGKPMSISYDKDSVKCMNYCPLKTKTINQNIKLSA
jgi:hypothetical protein